MKALLATILLLGSLTGAQAQVDGLVDADIRHREAIDDPAAAVGEPAPQFVVAHQLAARLVGVLHAVGDQQDFPDADTGLLEDRPVYWHQEGQRPDEHVEQRRPVAGGDLLEHRADAAVELPRQVEPEEPGDRHHEETLELELEVEA